MRQSAEVDHFCHELQLQQKMQFIFRVSSTIHTHFLIVHTRRLLSIIGFSILSFIFYSMLDHMSPFRHVVIMDISAIFSAILAQSPRHFPQILWRVWRISCDHGHHSHVMMNLIFLPLCLFCAFRIVFRFFSRFFKWWKWTDAIICGVHARPLLWSV